MSQEWLNIQSFFTDHELLGAINDLSIAIKQEAAGVQDAERERRAKDARRLLKRFLSRLGEVESADSKELLLGVDARFQSLTDAIASARQDGNRYQSVLMKSGAAGAVPLLDAKSPESRAQLVDSLAELRRVIEQHQQTDAAAIFEDR
ncbi:MAG: hypothetical protein HY000_23000 [Planctomycetes bacterium]|nr:hypothetical protein [Planctomycetota bacterium]